MDNRARHFRYTMKLATYLDGSRDGQLVVVSKDLTQAHYASGIANRLQQVLDDWGFLSPQLQDLSHNLNHGKARHAFDFDPAMCMAPLPRTGQVVQAQAYVQHLELAARARGEDLPDSERGRPVLFQGSSDGFAGGLSDLITTASGQGLDFGVHLAVFAADLPTGAAPAEGLDAIRLLGLANTWMLRDLNAGGLATRPEGVQGWLGTSFAPVVVTPDELGDAWQGGKASLPLQVQLNGRKLGSCDTAQGMSFHFGQLLSQMARWRPVRAGAVVMAGPVTPGDGKTCGCLADKRAQEAVDKGLPDTPYLQWGDTLRLEIKGADGLSLFGTIEQTVTDPQ
jgi:fumarylacetoacetate (FAA) hydrolase